MRPNSDAKNSIGWQGHRAKIDLRRQRERETGDLSAELTKEAVGKVGERRGAH